MRQEISGSVQFSCQVLLEHSTVQDDPLSITFHTPVFSNKAVDGSQLLACLFRFFKNNMFNTVPNGIYDVVVIVHASYC